MIKLGREKEVHKIFSMARVHIFKSFQSEALRPSGSKNMKIDKCCFSQSQNKIYQIKIM